MNVKFGLGAEYSLPYIYYCSYEKAREILRKDQDCRDSILVIINDKYVFYFEPYADCVLAEYKATKPRKAENIIAYLTHYDNKSWGQVRTAIWWEEFVKSPEKFYKYAISILPNSPSY